MLFSAHVVDTNPLKALRRKTPKVASTPGLRSARTGICAPFTRHALPRPQLGREAMIACWEDDAALDRFLAEDPTGQVLATGWCARLELVRAVGVFPGLNDDMVALAGTKFRDMTGPSVAFTMGTAYVKTAVPFLKVNNGLERQFLDTPSGMWGTAVTNVQQRFVATISVWESLGAASDYMKAGAHGAAVEAHFDPAKDPNGHTFVTGGGFLGFRPLAVTGSVAGKNPLNESLLAA